MKANFVMNPYVSVGEIKFGMNRDEVKSLFEQEPDFEYTDPVMKIKTLQWDNLKVRLNIKGKVEEISFFEGANKAIFQDINMLEEPALSKILDKIDKPMSTVGFKVYFKIGVAITGFSKKKDDKTVTIFSKELIPLWKK